jgi:hypothetical protein
MVLSNILHTRQWDVERAHCSPLSPGREEGVAIEVDAVDQEYPDESAVSASRFCPECGQFLPAHRSEATLSRGQGFSTWPLALLIVGAYLAVVFGSRVWITYQTLVDTRALEQGLAASASGSVTRPLGADVRIAQAAGAAHLPEIDAAVNRELARSISALALGLVTIFVGLAALARPKLLRLAIQRRSARGAGLVSGRELEAPLSLKAWAFAEGIYLSAYRILLIACGYFAASRLVQGDPPSWQLVNQALDRALDVVLALPGMLR